MHFLDIVDRCWIKKRDVMVPVGDPLKITMGRSCSPDAVIVAATVTRQVSLVLVKIGTVRSPIFDSVFFKCIEKETGV